LHQIFGLDVLSRMLKRDLVEHLKTVCVWVGRSKSESKQFLAFAAVWITVRFLQNAMLRELIGLKDLPANSNANGFSFVKVLLSTFLGSALSRTFLFACVAGP